MGGNGCWMLEQLVDSVVRQTYQDWEIIVSDDSKDDFIREWCETLPFIRYFHNGSRGKSSINMNNAILKATGELIKPMFQDDYFENKFALEKIVSQMKNEQWGICTSSNHTPYHPPDVKELALGNNRYGCPSVVVFRPCNILFDENLLWLMDCELYARMRHVFGLPKLIKTTIHIGKWDGSVTNTALEEIKKSEHEYVDHKWQFYPQIMWV